METKAGGGWVCCWGQVISQYSSQGTAQEGLSLTAELIPVASCCPRLNMQSACLGERDPALSPPKVCLRHHVTLQRQATCTYTFMSCYRHLNPSQPQSPGAQCPLTDRPRPQWSFWLLSPAMLGLGTAGSRGRHLRGGQWALCLCGVKLHDPGRKHKEPLQRLSTGGEALKDHSLKDHSSVDRP